MAKIALVPVVDLVDSPVGSRAADHMRSGVERRVAQSRSMAEHGLDTVALEELFVSLSAALRAGLVPRVIELGMTDVDETDSPEDDPPVTLDYVLPLGCAVEVDGVFVGTPGCCSDWRLLAALEDVLSGDGVRTEKSLWMGHDASSLSVLRDGERVVFSVGSESRDPPVADHETSLREAREALDKTWATIDALAALLEKEPLPKLARVVVPRRAG